MTRYTYEEWVAEYKNWITDDERCFDAHHLDVLAAEVREAMRVYRASSVKACVEAKARMEKARARFLRAIVNSLAIDGPDFAPSKKRYRSRL